MREILFRGKRKDNGEWIYGDLLQNSDCVKIREQEKAINGIAKCYEIEPETVGQFIGLKDKNGINIFEGDIVDCTNEWWDAAGFAAHDTPILVVKWSNGLCGFEPFAIYDSDCGVFIGADGTIVIGNIHDNPERLRIEE